MPLPTSQRPAHLRGTYVLALGLVALLTVVAPDGIGRPLAAVLLVSALGVGLVFAPLRRALPVGGARQFDGGQLSVLDGAPGARPDARHCSAPFDLRAALTEIVLMHASAAEANELELSLLVDEDAPAVVVGDAERVGQVVDELVANGVRFTERGALRVRVSRAQPASGSTVAIEVEDTGVGFSPQRIAEVFEVRGKLGGSAGQRLEGAGLDLALCRATVEGLGGSLLVRSKEGCGSTVRVELPLVLEPGAALPGSVPRAAPPRLSA